MPLLWKERFYIMDSRYLYLHEALGLGPMWLLHNTPIEHHLFSPSVPTTPSTKTAKSIPHHTQPQSSRSPQTSPNTHTSSRLAALTHLGCLQHNHNNPITIQPPSPPQSPTPEYTLPKQENIPQTKLMALIMCASPADIATGTLLSGEDGTLFRKMIDAIKLRPEDIYLSSWLKHLPNFNPNPPEIDIISATERVAHEYHSCDAQAILLMGRFFERDDVQTQLPQAFSDCPRFIIPHPQQMINRPNLKRKAWETLQQLQHYLDNHKK